MWSYLLFICAVNLAAISADVIDVQSFEDLNNQLDSSKSQLVVLSLYTGWCGPCKLMDSQLEKLSQEFADVVFLKVDIDSIPDVTQKYGARGVPTFFLIKNSETVGQMTGAKPLELRQLIEANH